MKRLLLFSVATFCALFSYAQLLTWTPPFPTENNVAQSFIITMDAAKGNGELLNYTPVTDVYVHIGVITNKSSGAGDWRYSKFTWATTPVAANATFIGNNKWTYTITGSLRSFFGITDATESIRKIAILFRNGAGTKKQANIDGSDMYIPVYSGAAAIRFAEPATQPTYMPVTEQANYPVGNYTIKAVVTGATTYRLDVNATTYTGSVSSSDTTTTSVSFSTPGLYTMYISATNATTILATDTLRMQIGAPVSPVVALPAGVQDGINYTGNTSATLVLRAPGKGFATVIGEFNNWAPTLMNKTPDGKYFWLPINGLTAGTEYGFQYVVDGTVKIADPYAEKLLDPFNDGFISSSTYPNLKPYPAGQTGIVSVLQTQQPTYNWGVNNFTKQDKRGLVIYELLVRDFIAAHDWKTLKDTLSYLKRLGINAVEIMPWTEFEGNNSWGYNTYQYFAADKYYGPKNTLKEFIDTCHKNGIAVIMDIVLNHTYGPSPLARLYWDAQNNRPATNNPWYNAVQPHAFGFGEDFNHESADTKYFFNRVLQHWITEFKVDGYRVDFSKGLTQKPSSNDATFSAYDASRIAIINGYAAAIKAIDPNSYIILEHFADNTEEKELADTHGLMLWANVWTQFQEASMGYIGNSNFDGGVHTTKGWTNPHLVTFMESHDEERITYKNIKYGNAAGGYTVKDTATALKRMELNTAFLLTIPGPKMIWQFGELGYDYSRCYLSTNGEGGDCDKKLDPKPIRWDYFADARRRRVYDLYSQLNKLRFHQWYRGVFQSSTIEKSLAGAFKWIKLTTANDTSDVMVIGNFDVVPQTATVTFPTAGTWYDYLGNFIHTSTGAAQSFTLQPGEFHVYVNRNVNNLTTTPVTNLPWNGTILEAKVYPNPVTANYTVEVKLPQSGSTRIELYNNVGQYITTVYNGFLTSGTKTIPLPALGLPKGLYFLKLQAKDQTKTISLTLQ